jgi:hypothetical protein
MFSTARILAHEVLHQRFSSSKSVAKSHKKHPFEILSLLSAANFDFMQRGRLSRNFYMPVYHGVASGRGPLTRPEAISVVTDS